MKVVIHDRTNELAPRLRNYTERRLNRLNRHFDKVLEAEVHFAPESRRGEDALSAVRILVHMDGRKKPLIKAEERGRGLKATLDLALDKVDRRVVKLKEKIVDRHHAGPEDAIPLEPAVVSDTVTEGPERVRQRVKVEDVDQAIAALDANGHLFHVYIDEDSGDLNVIYRRSDGSLAIIEPQIT